MYEELVHMLQQVNQRIHICIYVYIYAHKELVHMLQQERIHVCIYVYIYTHTRSWCTCCNR